MVIFLRYIPHHSYWNRHAYWWEPILICIIQDNYIKSIAKVDRVYSWKNLDTNQSIRACVKSFWCKIFEKYPDAFILVFWKKKKAWVKHYIYHCGTNSILLIFNLNLTWLSKGYLYLWLMTFIVHLDCLSELSLLNLFSLTHPGLLLCIKSFWYNSWINFISSIFKSRIATKSVKKKSRIAKFDKLI